MHRLLHIISFLPFSVFGQPVISPDRLVAPSSEEALYFPKDGMKVFGDTVLLHGQRLKKDYAELTGAVYSSQEDSTIVQVALYTKGQRSGTWYTLDENQRVTQVVEYAGNSTHQSYWYDSEGLLSQYCSMSSCHDDAFDRIFGGWCPGSCWSFDIDGRVTSLIEHGTDDNRMQIWYHKNGEMAQRWSQTRSTSIVEQWCPRGKRVGHLVFKKGDDGDVETRGTIMEWSLTDQAYYSIRFESTRLSLRKYPKGQWRHYDKKDANEHEPLFRLENVLFGESMPHVPLPCGLKR